MVKLASAFDRFPDVIVQVPLPDLNNSFGAACLQGGLDLSLPAKAEKQEQGRDGYLEWYQRPKGYLQLSLWEDRIEQQPPQSGASSGKNRKQANQMQGKFSS